MKQIIIIAGSLFVLMLAANKTKAQCTSTNASVKTMKILDGGQTQVILQFGFSPSNASYSGSGVVSFALKRPGLSDLVTNVAVSYNIPVGGGNALLNFFAYTGYSYTATFNLGCGTSVVSFTTDHIQNVTTCIGTLYNHEAFSVSGITSSSAVVNCSMPIHPGYTMQDLYISYRKKDIPSSIREVWAWWRDENWQLRAFTTDVYDYTTEPALPLSGDLTTITGLSSSTAYEVFLLQKLTNIPNPKDDVFKTPGRCVFNSSPGAGVVLNISPVKSFTTLGPCNSANGNYTAPAINNTAGTNLYTGTITSSAPVTLSTVQRKFTATGVVLNPGFVTAVTGTGNFIANGFNPANCASINARTAGQPEVEAVPITDSVVRNVTITYAAGKGADEMRKQPGVYPNPATGTVNIITGNANETIKQVIITDISGKTVFVSNTGKSQLNISKLTAGMYLYKVMATGGTYVGKLIKQ